MSATEITKKMGFIINPISINAEGSISASVSVGVIGPDGALLGATQQNHYIQPSEASVVLATAALAGEPVGKTLSRAVTDLLKSKGLLPY